MANSQQLRPDRNANYPGCGRAATANGRWGGYDCVFLRRMCAGTTCLKLTSSREADVKKLVLGSAMLVTFAAVNSTMAADLAVKAPVYKAPVLASGSDWT